MSRPVALCLAALLCHQSLVDCLEGFIWMLIGVLQGIRTCVSSLLPVLSLLVIYYSLSSGTQPQLPRQPSTNTVFSMSLCWLHLTLFHQLIIYCMLLPTSVFSPLFTSSSHFILHPSPSLKTMGWEWKINRSAEQQPQTVVCMREGVSEQYH